MSKENDYLEVAGSILRYLRENPEAQETLKGIAEWWLLKQRISEAVDQVSEALSWLVERGYLIETKSPGIAPIYKINPASLSDLENFLKDERLVE